MPQHHSLKCECTKSGWTREYQEIQPYGQGTLFEPQRTLSKDAMGEQTEENKVVADNIKRLKSLDHRHIVSVIGSYKVANGYSFLMYPLSYLTSTLFCIHENGLQHGKIAPKNIIHRGAEIYFTDSGLKMPWERDETTSTTSCTRTTTAYTAPEAEHIELRDARSSNIFSLGCFYLEMLTVLDNRSVKDFRMHYEESVKRNNTMFFQYYSAIPKIQTWFSYRCFHNPLLYDL
ncbi:hypothetical protein B0J12DRAFT_702370 [Macrophomina phaseolina]|uniref:Protein kinase domain-containing protein n=1 Tax=Macrophomina phaseolina TaxID=35725 RepID=A0ABQ8G1N2_9PEZI|nr:hypothetical protein B0J12DRAFT_702370 [Macrophomina phaseolina]